ncbi:hypothetical protein JGH11_00735 [Dysgonomonas sp. Marseille-P4677]|uniref:hypothetical protein n=1 Tax=Dysgonomonas sp. Marseille-P4677 TaxID=2364790 RepID=UPI00191457B3|nr:hypothetical protein [Dysgonomonas sp. Marseille-P4677]MBK5719385.1 hypothetical protein [Dysgonomonas sp. Marseille-P4677]
MKNNQATFNGIHDGKVILSQEFITLFPKMARLLDKAYKVEFTLNGNQRFRQYIWTREEGSTAGWLCKLEHCVPQGRNIIPEHILLSQTVGGIIDYWLTDSTKEANSFIDANEFTFSLVDSTIGIGGWEDNYINECKEQGLEPLNTSEFLTFALEANGNTTFYSHKTKEVFVYLHDDYSPFEITPHKGHPLCTIYQYDKAKSFVEYVEILAEQWLQVIQSEK